MQSRYDLLRVLSSLTFVILLSSSSGCFLFVDFECDNEGAEQDKESPCFCKAGKVLKECRELNGHGGNGEGGRGISSSTGGQSGQSTTVSSSNSGGSTTNIGGFPGVGGNGGAGGEGGSPPIGPCGPIPQTGLHVCWAYGIVAGVPSNMNVGLAGGSADPPGEIIENKFLDPMCESPNAGETFVLCPLGNPDPDWNIQFRARLRDVGAVGQPTGWDCSTDTCFGSVYLYSEGVEISTMVNDVITGTALSVIPHFNPPNLRNVKVTAP